MKNETLTEQLLSLFKNHIVKSAKEIAEIETQQKTDWFAQSECILMIQIDLRNEVYKFYSKNPTSQNLTRLQEACVSLQKTKRKARQDWQAHFTFKCQREDFKISPKNVWHLIFKLMEGFQAYHHIFCQKSFKIISGKTAKDEKNNISILKNTTIRFLTEKHQLIPPS